MYKITFQVEGGSEVTINASTGDNILQLAQQADVYIDAPCSGNGTCGKCRIKVVSGKLREDEKMRLPDTEYAEGWRLACRCYVTEDATVFVPMSAKVFMQGIRTADFSSEEELASYNDALNSVLSSGFEIGCSIKRVNITIDEPTLDDTTPDNERLIVKLQQTLSVGTVRLSNNVLSDLPGMLRENNFAVSCLVRIGKQRATIMEICPQDKLTPVCGIAVDIGTTTVSAALINLESSKIIARASSGNNQIRYGADVINRIIQAVKPGGREKLQRAVRDETLIPLIENMCEHAGIDSKQIYRLVVASNTTMNHLLTGTPSNSIRMEPYVPVFRELPGIMAWELGIDIHPEARVVIAPNVGSYVGGDITAGTLATMMWDTSEISLFIDLGTNGELVIGSGDFMMCCACSAGPAFEGGDISHGMRATLGAVEACVIDKETMEPQLSVIGPEDTKIAGLCGSGIIDTISELFRCGIIDSRGKFCREGRRVRYDDYGGAYILAFADENGRDIELTEIDIDNFIRAKGAIYSAISSMLETIDMSKDDISNIYIAGGIGSGINLTKAIGIGMLPDIPLDKYKYIGNSSLTGACAMLLSQEIEYKVYELERNMTYLELSAHPGYMDEFVAACFLPHTNAGLFPKLD